MEQTKNIKERLILASLELFSEQGIHGVSMRNINVLAGTKNSGAAHYHFGNKLGLLEALIVYLNEALSEIRGNKFEEIKVKAEAGELVIEDLLEAFFEPYARLYQEKEYGQHAVKFYARLAVEADLQLQTLINRHHKWMDLWRQFYLISTVHVYADTYSLAGSVLFMV